MIAQHIAKETGAVVHKYMNVDDYAGNTNGEGHGRITPATLHNPHGPAATTTSHCTTAIRTITTAGRTTGRTT